jgi:hypothetical protein
MLIRNLLELVLFWDYTRFPGRLSRIEKSGLFQIENKCTIYARADRIRDG